MNEYFRRCLWHSLVFAAFLLLAGPTSAVRANTFIVNSTDDRVDASPGDGKCETNRDVPGIIPAVKECTLRAAVQESNALAGKHKIVIPAGNFLLTHPTLCGFHVKENPSTLTETSTSLCITGQVSITGAGANSTFIDGDSLSRVVFLDSNASSNLAE